MLRANERICACGCGQIIALDADDAYIIKPNRYRKKYYASRWHLPKRYKDIYEWMIENEYLIKPIIKEALQ